MEGIRTLLRFPRRSSRQGDGGFEEAVEHVIDAIDPRLRLVPGYLGKLQPGISAALTYIGELVDQVPGPVELSRDTFVHDPLVGAIFATTGELQEVLSSSDEIAKFFADPANLDNETCFALLCAQKEEKTFLGSELDHDVVRREVMQTAIGFFDHKILSPAARESDVREGIKCCVFDGLVTFALQRITQIKSHRQELEDQRRILHARLRAREAQGNGLSTLIAEAHTAEHRTAEIAEQLESAERRLHAMPSIDKILAFYLDEVAGIFSRPEEFIRLDIACFYLDAMNIRVNGDESKSASTVCFSELEIADVLKRIVTVVRCSRQEVS